MEKSSNLIARMIENNNLKEQERKPLPRIFTEDFDKLFNEAVKESYLNVRTVDTKSFDIYKITKEEKMANDNGPKIRVDAVALRSKYIPIVLSALSDKFFNLEMFDEKQLFEQCLPKINQYANPSKRVLWDTIEEIIKFGLDCRYIAEADKQLYVKHLIDDKFAKKLELNDSNAVNI